MAMLPAWLWCSWLAFGHIPLAEAELTCSEVQRTVAPCLGYLRDPDGPVPEPCCNGVRSINNKANTTPDRQGVCRCLKATALSVRGVLNLPSLEALPGKCGVNLPYKISPTIDCNT
ncbi:Non-specific lipid-transfer protein [Spatholobus suberectus]|nr:Non-specific lipid-transfer protein [Spatholobus suberectus]